MSAVWLALGAIVPIVVALVAGMQARRVAPGWLVARIDRLTQAALSLLLLMMGASIGSLPDVGAQMARIGGEALLLALATSGGSALAVALALGRTPVAAAGGAGSDARGGMARLLHHVAEPLGLAVWVLAGFGLAYADVLPRLPWGAVAEVLLYVLIFCIGLKLALGGVRLGHLLRNRRGLAVAVLTALGAWGGALALGAALAWPPGQSLALASGFGWYSLSGLLFTQMGAPMLGALGFMTDVLRELLALLLLPLLARSGWAQPGMAVAGATAMDVALPLIERQLPAREVAVGFVSGTLLTLAAPVWIPLWFAGAR